MRKILTPEGLFIYDRDTGLCFFTRDVRSKSWGKPLYAQIALTEKCNLSCWFCYARSSPNKRLEWEIGDLKELIDFLDSWGLLGISLGGGEPFLYTHLAEIVKYAWKKTGLDVTVTTNGTAASEKIAEIEGYVSEVRVSIRRAEALPCLKKFIGRKFEVGVNLLLFRGGSGELDGIIEGALRLGVSDFLLNSFRTVGGGENMEPTAEDYAKLAEIIRRFSDRATFKVSGRVAAVLKGQVGHLVPFSGEAEGRIIAITVDKKIKLSSLSDVGFPFTSCGEIPRIYNNLVGGGLHEV
jgi:MoaA/NifB/PqqE/SkfB family radical SAM enzyme